MSAMESMIWNILGYAAMPTIFITGFLITAVFTCFLLELTGNSND
ncbi:TIGR02808 family protein [Aestuariirhabdus sp. LZHN29]